jgi:hypothetical protein
MAVTQFKTGKNLLGAAAGLTNIAAFPRLTTDGAQFTSQWLQKMALEGRMYSYHSGTGTAPNTFAGAYVNTTPDLDLSVPAGVVAIPISLTVQFETYGTILLTEVIGAIGVGGVIAPTSATAVPGKNHRLDLGDLSGLTCVSDGTGATYMTSNVVEFFRDGHQGDVSVSAVATGDQASNLAKFQWSALQSGVWPIMYNPSGICRLNVHACSQAGTGFITLVVVVPPLVSEE